MLTIPKILEIVPNILVIELKQANIELSYASKPFLNDLDWPTPAGSIAINSSETKTAPSRWPRAPAASLFYIYFFSPGATFLRNLFIQHLIYKPRPQPAYSRTTFFYSTSSPTTYSSPTLLYTTSPTFLSTVVLLRPSDSDNEASMRRK